MDKNSVQNLIKEILEKMNISVSNIEILEEDNSKTIWYSMSIYLFSS